MLFVGYLWLWFRANGLREINLTIEESTVVIKTGDIFKQEGLKVIALMNTLTLKLMNESLLKPALMVNSLENTVIALLVN